MANNNASTTDRDINLLNIRDIDIATNHTALLANMEQLFTEARPRLLRVAYLNGVANDCVEDVVQETLMEAWRHLANLREPQRFSAWLDGICRNVCRRQKSTLNNTLSLHELLSTSPSNNDEPLDINTPFDRVDPLSSDPLEELSQQDLAVLLDHAMGYLPVDTRRLMEMCYFAELPQREVATRLGLTIGALELRLHRARLQLRQVLNRELRTEAQSFGLILDIKDALDWQQTRQWCFLCGKRRMLSRFEMRSDGHVDLCTRCPECSRRYDLVMLHSMGMVSLDGLHTFRPALKRLVQHVSKRISSWSAQGGTCLYCAGPAKISVCQSHESNIPVPPDRYWISVECPKCGNKVSDIMTTLISLPAVQRFLIHHERFVSEPYRLIEYNSVQVICACLTDIASADQITVLIDAQNLHCLATFAN